MDKRKLRSQLKLQDALVLHLKSKSIDEITIGELTKTAGVSRQTFYANFDSKQSVLLSRVDLLLLRAKSYFSDVQKEAKQGKIIRSQVIERSIKYLLLECEKEGILLQAVLSGKAGVYCMNLIKCFLATVISSRILDNYGRELEEDKLAIITDFYSGALLGIINGFLYCENRSEVRDDEVASLVGTLIPYGMDGIFMANEAIKNN